MKFFNMRKFSTVGLFVVALLFIRTTRCCLCGVSTTIGCVEEERQALLKFKHSLTNNSRLLSSWHGQDCCNWKGIQCDGITGHVVKLDLHADTYWISSVRLVAKEVDSCLLQLKYLNHLDLSGNDFQGSPIPKFFGAMARLRYLNLSYAGFRGMVPHQLGNLSSLRVLDLDSGYSNYIGYHALTVDDLTWVSHLSSLQYLDMTLVNLSQAHNLNKVLNMLPSLLELRLSWCRLENIHLSHMHVNSTVSNVEYLDLSHNSFGGEFPSLLRNMTSLRVLDLSDNYFNSSSPLYTENLKSLEHLILGYNYFNDVGGLFMRLLSNHCSLKSFDIRYNRVFQKMPIPYGNLSGCTTYNLETLILSGNGIAGHLPNWLGQFKHMKYLDLSDNSFNATIPAWLGRMSALQNLLLGDSQLIGVIPPSLGNLSALRVLDLSYNQLNGTIPVSIGQLSNLKTLDVSSNSLEGEVFEAHFANLYMLEDLRMSSNFLTLKVRSEWIPPFQLKFILLGSCKVGTQFPQWLQTQKKVVELDLSNASISGTLPEWLHNMHLLNYLELSDNHISGPIPRFPSTLSYVYLSNNLISGPLPQNIGDMMPNLVILSLAGNLINGSIPNSLCKIVNLKDLDLSKNRFSGNLPDCWGELSNLEVMKCSSNKLSGVIPSSIGNCTQLTWLHLNNNSLYGELPLALKNCTNLILLDLGENGFTGNIPRWIGEFESLVILRLHKNMFNGKIPSQLCQFLGQIMDFADNNLTGTIPRCFANLTGMIFSEVEGASWRSDENMMQIMKGNELDYKGGTLYYLVNMDLSRNNLVGTIPEELTRLSALLGLNLSHNNLRGSIPKNFGGLKSLESLDFSNNQLSGAIPQSLSTLNFMSHLNLSYNNLSGPIPTGSQLQTLVDPSIYVGNSELCGDPLPRKCPGDEHSQPPTTTSHEEKYEGDHEFENVWFYLVIMSGYATGLWGVLGVLLFKKNWRHAYFRFVDMTKEKVMVAIAVRMVRLNNYFVK